MGRHPRIVVLSAVAVVGGLVVLTCSTAEAQNPNWRLTWRLEEGSPQCSAAGSIAQRVVARLGRDPFAEPASRTAETTLGRSSGQWTAHVVVRDREGGSLGTREVTSAAEDCEPIVSAAVLAIALAIDPEAMLPPSEPPKPVVQPPPPPAVRPVPEPPVRPVTQCQASAPTRQSLSMLLRAGAASGLLPEGGLALGWFADASLGKRLHAISSALWLPEVESQGSRIGFGLTAVGGGLCADALRCGPIALAGCFLAYGGAIHSVVHQTANLRPVDTGDRGWAAVSVLPRLRYTPLAPITLEAGLEVVVPLTRWSFGIQGLQDSVFRQSLLSLVPFGAAGIEF